MTDKAKLLDQVKKIVRALLISAPHGLTVRELCKDFQAMEGYTFPFRKLGIPNAEMLCEVLKSEHVLRISYEGGCPVLRGLADESTVHIAAMVSRQKKKPPPRSRQRGYTVPPRFQHQSYVQSGIPPSVKRNIITLLSSFRDGLLGSDFLNAYARRFGQHLNYSQWFKSLREFFNSLVQDIVYIEDLSPSEYRVSPSEYRVYLIGNQRSRTPSAEQQPMQQQYSPFSKPTDSCRSQAPLEGRQPNPTHQAGEQPTWGATGGGDAPSFSDERAKSPQLLSRDNNVVTLASNVPSVTDAIYDLCRKTRLNVQMVLEKRPNGVFGNRMLAEYRNFTNEELPLKRLGYISVVEMMSAMPDIVSIERPSPNGDWLLFDKRLHQAEHEKEKVEKVRWQDTVMKCLNAHPQGLILGEIPHLYKKLTGHSLKPINNGFVSFEKMILSEQDKTLHVEYQGGLTVVYPLSKKPKNTGMEEAIIHDVSSHKETAMKESQRRRLPPDAVEPGVHYTLQPIPPDITTPDVYVEVFISNVNNPSQLWLQFRGKETTEALEETMDELEYSYECPDGHLYRVPDDLYQIGMVCAALFPEDSNWHRCVIIGINDNPNLIEVYFVDYGNRCTVEKKNIRLLKSKFLGLPCQAIEAKLANIKPTDGETWKIEARNYLLKLCANRLLVAMVTEVSGHVLTVCLCDTSSDKDVHINDMLVEDGYAMFIDREEPVVPCHESNSSECLSDEINNLELEDLPEQRYIKQVTLTQEHSVHLINYGGSPYLLSTEISRFLWPTDCLKLKLRQKKRPLPVILVTLDENPELYEEFKHFNIDDIICNGEVKLEQVSLYQLESVPSILNLFKHPSSELKQAVDELITSFDPKDKYWLYDEEVSDDDDDAPQFDLEEIKLLYRALECRRQHIQEKMMSSTVEGDLVEVLSRVELQMKNLAKKIKEIEAENKVSDHPEQAFISQCIMDQYKDVSPSHSVMTSKPPGLTLPKAGRVAPVLPTPRGNTTNTGVNSVTPPPDGVNFNPLNQQQMISSILYQQNMINQMFYMQSMGVGRGVAQPEVFTPTPVCPGRGRGIPREENYH